MPPKYFVAASILAVSCLVYIGIQRPSLSPAATNLPDNHHRLALYTNVSVTQRLVAEQESLAAARLVLREPLGAPYNTDLLLHVREANSEQDLRTVETTLREAIDYTEMAAGDTTLFVPTIFIPFAPVRNARGQTFDITLEAPHLSPEMALRLAYQIDDTKFPSGQIIFNRTPKAGDLGFVLYEQPPLALTAWRWLTSPGHTTTGPAILALMLGLAGSVALRMHRTPPPLTPFWQEGWQHLSPARVAGMAILLGLVVGIVYSPAIEMFFIQDDITKLLRVERFSQNLYTLFATNTRYLEPGERPLYGVGFYRPLSFSVFPWLLWLAFGLNPVPYHVSSLVLITLCALALAVLGTLIVRSALAGLVMGVLWTVHSSKVPLAFWWSSTEDLLANAAILLAILCYTAWRATGRRAYFSTLLILFAGALLSKEHSFILIPALGFLEILAGSGRRDLWRQKFVWLRWLSPIVVVAALYILVRVVAIHDPTLPVAASVDRSYDLTLDPLNLGKNIVAYASWTSEHWLWQRSRVLHEFFAPLEANLGQWFVEIQNPPYNPGLFLLAAYGVALAHSWRHPTRRRVVLLAGGWWFMFLQPILLLKSAWAVRWLTLSSWSIALLAGALVAGTTMQRPAVRRAVVAILITAVTLYGAWAARQPETSAHYRTLSYQTMTALQRFREQEAKATPTSTVYFIGVPHDPRGSINIDLLRLFSDTPPKHVVYDLPAEPTEADIVIDLTDVF